MKTIEGAAQEYSGRKEIKIKTTWTNEREMAFKAGVEFAQRWIPVEEELPEASKDKSKWWTSDIGEVFPYSEECIVENENGSHFVAKYSVLEKCWDVCCGSVVKWRYLELK